MPVPVTERVNRLPRLPFLVVLGVSALLLAVAFEYGHFGSDDRVTAVEEAPRYADGEGVPPAPEPRPAEVRIVESGFGTVLDENGDERGTVGAIVRNTGTEAAGVALSVRFRGEGGADLSLAELDLSWIPPGDRFYLGSTFPLPERVAPSVSELSLEIEEASSFADATLNPSEGEPGAPELAVTDVAPLFTPAGARIEFEAETRGRGYLWTASVLFRDESGAIVGGMPATVRPLAGDDWAQPLPDGRSVHHLNLPEHAIPEGADLEAVEIGPSGRGRAP